MTSPIHTSEREDFEAWYCADAERQGMPMREGIAHLREGEGYGDHRVMLNGKWEGWQARASTAAKADAGDLEAEIARLRAGLEWYANGNHYTADDDTMDTVSGEPQNWLCHSEDLTMIEDGSIARHILNGAVMVIDNTGDVVCEMPPGAAPKSKGAKP